MSAVPVTISGVVYPKNKKDPPYAVTIMGFAEITGLGVGGGPVLPPGVIPPVEPPLVIWPPVGGPELPPYPDNTLPPIVDPPIPPVEPPTAVEPPHEGWNWSAEHSGWYFLYIPGEGEASPKKKR
jgi:hypothetical protein